MRHFSFVVVVVVVFVVFVVFVVAIFVVVVVVFVVVGFSSCSFVNPHCKKCFTLNVPS